MRYYLDTSSLRSMSDKLALFTNYDIYTSSLAIFELIAGITESEYLRRKKIIGNVLNSGISIDWETYKQKMHAAFRIPYKDIESDAIKEISNIILNSNRFDDIDNTCRANKVWFRLESFQGLDKDISDDGRNISDVGIQWWRQEYDKKHRKNINLELFDNGSFCSYVHTLAEIQFIGFLEEITGTKRPSPEYFKALEVYDESMDLYFWCTQLQFSLAQLKGMQYGKNDTMDTLHTIFVSKNDTIVSDDKIFKDLEKWGNYFTCMTTNEFIESQNSI